MFAYFLALDKSRYVCRASRYLLFAALLPILLSPPDVLAAEKTSRLLAIGDSLVAGYGLPAAEAFTARLEAALIGSGLRVRVINAGVSGDTSAGGRARIAWSLVDKPVAVLVELGANDGMRGLDPSATKANLDAILSQIRSAGAEILLTGMLAPPNLGREYGAEFAALYPALAHRHGVLFYPFFLEGVAANPELNQADRIHPNAAGVDIIVKRLLPMVKELLQKVQNKREHGG
jgi:acyl-CoA thioesterase-1